MNSRLPSSEPPLFTGTIPGFARSAIAMSITHWVLFAINLSSAILVARFLGPEGKGIYALVLLFVAIFVYFGNLGVHRAGAFFLSRREYPSAEIFGHTLFYLAILTVGVVTIAMATRPLLWKTVFPGVSPTWFGFGMPIIVGQLVFGFLTMLLLGVHEIAGYNLAQLLRGAGSLLMGAALLLAGYGVAGVLLAESVSWLVVTGLVFVLVFRRTGGISLRVNPRYVRASLTYGIAVYSADALYFFHYRTALILLSILATPAVVGLYSAAAAVAGTLSLLSQGAATVLFPRISSDPSGVRDKELTPFVLRTTLVVSGTAAILLALAGPSLIVIAFGRAFGGSVQALIVLLPGAVALSGWSILDSYFKGVGRPMWSTFTTGLSVIVGAALSAWWIPRFGLLGASAATSTGYALSLIAALVAYMRFSGLALGPTLIPRRADFARYRAVLIQISRLRSGEGTARADPTGERF